MKGTLRWFVLGFLILFALWYINGGPAQEEAKKNAFIDPPKQSGPTVQQGGTYDADTLKNRFQQK